MESLLSSLWSINCFASLTPAANFLTRALLLPLFFALGPACAHISFIHVSQTAASSESRFDSRPTSIDKDLPAGQPQTHMANLHSDRDFGLPMPAFLHLDLLCMLGAISMQRASKWFGHHADCTQRLLQLYGPAFELVHHGFGDADCSSGLLGSLFLDPRERTP